ncbi:MAG: ammonia-forming cytochrome c nitrite reductase subunit c552, partial [Burkholderiaceae bacterium]|nr:ammonia-forming cytochrome c nitrite reductase subunit c552 [Burkholderiaceae bacterium]
AAVGAAVVLLDAAAHTALAQAPAAQAKPVAAAAKAAPKKVEYRANQCLDCHEPIKAFHDGGKHKTVACSSCHEKLDVHLKDKKARPTTITDPAACGTCHKNQFQTMYQMNWEKTARKEKSLANGPSPSPAFEKLMTPHGFTREHAEPRSHAFALYDQVVVDRAFGGRFKNKDGWAGLAQEGGNFNIWDKLVDEFPGQDHKAFKPGTAAAANPVCMSCKTADHILDWAYLGDPHPNAKWSRTSKVVDFVKDTKHSLNCFMCHDPHSGGPRVVRDGLIQALTRPEADTLYHADKKGAKINVVDLGTRGFTRKIATMSRPDAKLMCAQCHVEYNCNPGTDLEGKPVTMADSRTNHFPLKKVSEIGKHYNDLKFRDFKHGITGAWLWKGQHPDVEVFYGSPHQKAGADCSNCHMPKVKDAKTGKTYTSHWATSPKHYIKETCLTCHEDWKPQQAVYAIDSLRNRFEGKKRKAEFWLTRLVDKFEEAKNIGVEETVLESARGKHAEAHINWEYWTAANGAHFHNPDEATTSLNKSVVVSQEGIKILDDAMAARRKAVSPVASAAPATAAAASAAK